MRWANHTQETKADIDVGGGAKAASAFSVCVETVEEEIALSPIKAEAAAQEPKCNRDTRHKNQQPGGVDRHLGFNWKQKQNNRAIHKSETKEVEAIDKQ